MFHNFFSFLKLIFCSLVHNYSCYSWTWNKPTPWIFQSDQQTRTLSEFSISWLWSINFWASKSCSKIQQFTSLAFFEWNKRSRKKFMGDENFNWSRWKIRFEAHGQVCCQYAWKWSCWARITFGIYRILSGYLPSWNGKFIKNFQWNLS